MARYIWEADIDKAIAAIEGDRWLKDQARLVNTPNVKYGVEAHCRGWAESQNPHKYGSGIIYGGAGVSRYIVLEDGEVVYSTYHGTQSDLATSMGFRCN